MSDEVDELPEEFGRYRIVRELGRGGMGKVYLAEDTTLDRKVALKIPVFAGEGSEKEVKRFLREARSAATIQHPNVCAVYDVGDVDGRYFLTMAYIQGESLAAWMQSRSPVDVPVALGVIRNVAMGLQAAHDNGVVHRDLKPGNILMDESDKPLIIDFGMARRFDRDETVLTATGTIAGTPAYMAPEQITGSVKEVGPAVDIYALGIIMYELLTGETPFSGRMATMLGSIVSEPPPPLRTHAEALPSELEPICARALAKRPEDRFESAAELAAALPK